MKRRAPRILSRDAVGECEIWDLPAVEGHITAGAGGETATPLTARALEEIQKQAYHEGFNLGRRAGREAGQREVRVELERTYQHRLDSLASLLATLATPIENLDEEMERSLVEMAILIARQLVRRELKTSPDEIVAVVREAIASLPVSSRHVRIHLNPEDVEIVRRALSLGEMQEHYAIEEDPIVSRGGCLLETATSFIDATVEARLNAVIAGVFGGVREGERSG
ncbi:MAG: flagellar assembly protein FliH [Chromatiales bacterium]